MEQSKEKLEQKIVGLYDSAFGRMFKSFRNLISLMWDFWKSLAELEAGRMDHEDRINRQNIEISKFWSKLEGLEKRVAEQEAQIAYLKQKAPLTTFRTPTQIMDAQFKAINPDD